MIKIHVKLIIVFLTGALFLTVSSLYAVIFVDKLNKTVLDTEVLSNAASDVNLQEQTTNNILILYSSSGAEKLPALKAEYDFSIEHAHRAIEILKGREYFSKYVSIISDSHAEIMALSEKVMNLRQDREDKENNFKIIVAGLKDNRHKTIDQTASGSANLKMVIDQMGYKDKEFNFQYQDKKHADEWIESIETVKNELKKGNFLDSLVFIDAYYELAQQSILTVNDINDFKLKVGYYLDNISNIGLKSEIANAQIIKIIDGELNEFLGQNKSKGLIPFAIILFSFFITGIIIFRVSRSITQSVEKLAEAADKISKGDWKNKVDIKSNDEMEYLASIFNQMIENIQKTQSETKERASRMKAIISSMGEGLFVLDKNLNIVLINKVAENLLGVLSREAAGKEVRDIIRVWKNEKELLFEELPVVRMLKTGKTVAIAAKDNYYYHSVSGKAFPVEIVTAPLIKDSRIVGGVVLFRDITAVKEIEKEREFARVNLKNALESVYIERDAVREQKNKLETILNSIGDAVFAVDTEKKIIILNPTAERITGFGFREVKGHIYNKYLKFTDEITKKEKNAFIGEALKGKQAAEDGHTLLEAKGKKLISINKTTAPIRNFKEEIVGCIVIFRDITAEREVERMRSDFISVVSHQLRTPLSAMKWFAEILASGDVGILKPKQKDLIKNIYLSNQSMIDLINQMLTMSRIEENRLAVNPEEINLEDEIGGILKNSKPFLDKKRQKLNFTGLKDKNLKINADKVLLKNIIDNLVGNASKYTPSGGEIKVSVSAWGKNYLLFKVSDNGIGIPKEEQYKVFKKFFRAKNGVEYEANGTGLGLYIVKSILEMIKGKIWFKSKENKGTDFYFTMPVDISKIGEK